MFTLAQLSLALLASTAAASPVNLAKKQDLPEVYYMRVSAPSLPNLDGLYLSTKNNTIGIYTGGQIDTAMTVRPTSNGDNTWTLDMVPTGIIPHQVGLVGDPSVSALDLMDVAMPNVDPVTGAGTTITTPQPIVSTRFTWRTVDPATGEATNKLSFVQPFRSRWAAYPARNPGEMDIRWYDGTTISLQHYLPVEIELEWIHSETESAPAE